MQKLYIRDGDLKSCLYNYNKIMKDSTSIKVNVEKKTLKIGYLINNNHIFFCEILLTSILIAHYK